MRAFDTIEDAVNAIRLGKIVIVVDDEDRENEGDFIMAAEKVTPEKVNFMASQGRGLICVPVTEKRAKNLELAPMVQKNNSQNETAFTVSVDSVNAGTGISCADRATTIRALAGKKTAPLELLRPGHVFPLIAKNGGVLRRAGHTEAAIDLVHLAELGEAAVICEIMNPDGSMAKIEDLVKVAGKYDLKLITIKDLIEYRIKKEIGSMVKQTTVIDFPSKYGMFKLYMFESSISPQYPNLALVKGTIDNTKAILVRVHSECLTGDIFGSLRCDCGEQLSKSMQIIENEGTGVLLYMRQEGRGIGLPNKIKAYKLQDQGYDTVSANHKLGLKADLREYGVGAQILYSLGVRKIKLLTNNPKKIIGLEGFNLEVVERCPIEVAPNMVNKEYLMTKKNKMGHILSTLQ